LLSGILAPALRARYAPRRDGPNDKETQALLAAALKGTLTEAQADRIEAIDAELPKLALLATSKRIAEQKLQLDELQAKLQGAKQPDPNTPSGQRPIYAKPPAPKRKRKPGAREGHKGAQRPAPRQIDEHVGHRAQFSGSTIYCLRTLCALPLANAAWAVPAAIR
jgi:hypothetical protein